MSQNLVYCVTPTVNGESLGLGAFTSEELAVSAMIAFTEEVRQSGSSITWQDHGWLTEDEAEDLAFREFLSSLGMLLSDEDDYS